MKKLFAFCLSAVLLCGISAAALNLDASETVYSETEITAETASETSVYEKGAPGINILTGTALPETFEEKTISDFKFQSWDNSKSAYEIVTDTERENNKALCFTKGHFLNLVISGIGVDGERPLYLCFDSKSSGTATKYLITQESINGKRCASWNENVTHTSWKTLGDRNEYRKLTTTAESWTTLYFGYAQGVTEAVYIDNLFIAPYYKITYNAGEGTGESSSEYFYADKFGVSFDGKGFTAPDGKVFSHWLDKNGNKVYSTLVPVPGSDIELTAVYADKNSIPSTLPETSIKYDTKVLMRTAGFVTDSLKAAAEEYGFIAALESSLANCGLTGLTFENTAAASVYGKAYSKSEGTDISYGGSETFGASELSGGTVFTAVYTGIPETAEAYKTKIAGRTYVKIGDSYFYGNVVSASLYDTALAEKKKFEDSGKSVPDYITEIIEKAIA